MRILIPASGLSVLLAIAGCSAPEVRENPPATTYQTRSSQGEIAFELTPRPWKSGRLIIDIRANTHGGDLAELKLKDVVKLQVGNQAYRPIEAANLAGHHAEGSVTFEVPEKPDRFTVTITGVRSMNDLKFEWP